MQATIGQQQQQYEANMEFPEEWGGGIQTQTPSIVGYNVWICSGTHIEWLITIHHVESSNKNNHDTITLNTNWQKQH